MRADVHGGRKALGDLAFDGGSVELAADKSGDAIDCNDGQSRAIGDERLDLGEARHLGAEEVDILEPHSGPESLGQS
jgi:hypothetical protein